ncbi:YnfU family zinc-binding protein [Serratia sp. DD3]|uniref:YnfU family zinc-binding protein n=1 Tax=Serratia sp. DD3 TaxID=1410619 RepID=UPI002100E0AD|nr:YnfU family zinc-binding protein [Serratia sp. DD3]
MSIFDSFKMFGSKSVDVRCPKCSRTAQQSTHKSRKNMTMICPHCGYYFRRGDDKP